MTAFSFNNPRIAIKQGTSTTSTGSSGSFAQGSSLVASGNYGSFAQGKTVTASGNSGSFAQGSNATASGINGSFAQGNGAISSGSYGSFAQGDSVLASGDSSFAQGSNATASANESFAHGSQVTASAIRSWAIGDRALASKQGQFSKANGRFSSDGDAQYSFFNIRIQTTNATPADLTLDGSTAAITIPASTTCAFRVLISGRQTGGAVGSAGDSWAYELHGCIKRDGSNNTAIVGSVMKNVIAEDDSDCDATATADDTSEALKVTVTGEANRNINWVGMLTLVECGG